MKQRSSKLVQSQEPKCEETNLGQCRPSPNTHPNSATLCDTFSMPSYNLASVCEKQASPSRTLV